MSLREDITKVVDKEFGAGTTMTLGQLPECGVSEWVSTGSILLNAAIHRPGIPVGRLTVISGRPASGKTTLVSHLIRSTQEVGGLAVLMDTEHSYDPSRAARIGIKNEDVLFYQDLCLEEAFSIVYRIADVSINAGSKQLVTIILDSHSGTPTRAEVKAEPDDSRSEIASSARVTSLHLRRLIGDGMIDRARAALVFVCQIKSAVPLFGPAPDTYQAKAAIDYHSSLIIKLKRTGIMSSKDGINVRAKIEKNKVGPPFSEVDFEVYNEYGLDEHRALLEAAVEAKLVSVKGGGHYQLGEEMFRKKEWPGILRSTPSLRRELFGICTGMLSMDGHLRVVDDELSARGQEEES